MREIQSPRGTQDIVAPASERFRAHEDRSAALFARAGYRPIITPMFEDTAVFARGVGEGSDIVSKEMYTFDDRGGNSVTLRPEGTAGVMRAVISTRLFDAVQPVKVWYSAAMFRYDRPQKGRYRQHHQLGVEAIGTEEPAVDAEVVALGAELLRAAGVTDATLHLNSNGHPGPDCRDAYRPMLLAFLDEHRDELDADCHRRMETNPLRVFDCKNERDQAVLEAAPVLAEWLCDVCRAHFDAVKGYLDDAGIVYRASPRLVRGLDYYTRTTFEFKTDLLEAAQNTVCGGGRYDGLSELLGGPSLPGIGFGSGIERVLLAAEAAGATSPARLLDAFIVPVGDTMRTCVRWARELRARGASVDIAYRPRALDKQMKRAAERARFAVIIGPDEVSAGRAQLKNLERTSQRSVPLDAAWAYISGAEDWPTEDAR